MAPLTLDLQLDLSDWILVAAAAAAARVTALTALLAGCAQLWGLLGGGTATLATWRAAASASLLLCFLWYTGAPGCCRGACTAYILAHRLVCLCYATHRVCFHQERLCRMQATKLHRRRFRRHCLRPLTPQASIALAQAT